MNMQIILLVEQVVMKRLMAKASFTALDISNALKSDRYAVMHREVAEIIRDIYQSDAMDFYDYRRRLIDVTTDGGTKNARTFLYLHSSAKEREYAARIQTSLPPVPPDIARDLADSLPAGPILVLPRPPRLCHAQDRRQKHRRDEAFAVSRSLVGQLGWTAGMSLGLSVQSGQVRLATGEGIPVQVWTGLRVRISKRKLRRCGLFKVERLSVILNGDGLRLVIKED